MRLLSYVIICRQKVVSACEKCVVLKEVCSLAVVLQSISVPLVKENELWRIRRNDELEDTIKGENIARFIKSQRIRWLGQIERMQDTAIHKKMLYGKLSGG
jgi:hypothetical protein